MKHFEVNSVGPVMVTSKFLPLLEKSDKEKRSLIVNISSTMGSLNNAMLSSPNKVFAYGMSKVSDLDLKN